MMVGTEEEELGDYKHDIDIKHEPLSYNLDDINSAFVAGVTPISSDIKREVEENEEDEKIDIKYTSLDYGLERPVIENANENAEKQFECHKCSFKSKYKGALKMHISCIHEKKRLACTLCPYETIRKGDLNEHMKRMHQEKKNWLECYNCGYKFREKSDLKKHIMYIHQIKEKQFECHKCSFKTKYKSHLKMHVLWIHEKEKAPRLACKLCPYETVRKGDLNQHIKCMHEEKNKWFKCDNCGYKSIRKAHLNNHNLLIHGREKAPVHACGLCSYETIHKGNLSKHITYKHETMANQFECHKCSYKSRQKSSLKTHILLNHEQKKAPRHVCKLCPYETIHKGNLVQHIMYMHEKKGKLFECDECNYKSKNKQALRIHMRIHTGSLECILCQQSFKQKQHIDAHYVSAHRDQSDSFKHLLTYEVTQCSECSYATVKKSHFKHHLLTHGKDRDKFKFECHTCGFKSMYKSQLKRHVRLHADLLPFACTECNKRFNEKRQLNRHIVSRHQENEQLMKSVTSKINQCPKCTYKTLDSLKKHMKRHDDD